MKLGIGRNEHLESHRSHTWQLVGRSKTAFAPVATPCTAAAVVDVADRDMLVPLAVASATPVAVSRESPLAAFLIPFVSLMPQPKSQKMKRKKHFLK